MKFYVSKIKNDLLRQCVIILTLLPIILWNAFLQPAINWIANIPFYIISTVRGAFEFWNLSEKETK